MLYNSSVNACDRRDGDGDELCYRNEAVMHVKDVFEMVVEVIDIVIRSKLYYM